jgi:predicted ArsR family transcriptional regulator
VSLPPRDYELAGRLLARAADRARSGDVAFPLALDDVTRDEGRRLADEIRTALTGADAGTGAGAGAGKRRRAVVDALERRGFEPAVAGDDGTVVLRNCPFHRLAQEHRELICGMNHCLLDAAIEDVGRTGLHARLAPEAGLCCVQLHPAP